jgi:L-ascorbate metabolism protein UlaG (beta-lactamase superfamily)
LLPSPREKSKITWQHGLSNVTGDMMILIKWLGINGFEFNYAGKTILLDPYVTRNNEILCNFSLTSEYIKKADYIFIGHSHWDHLADAPEIAKRTGALVIGSRTTINICRALGVPEEQLLEFISSQTLSFPGFSVDIIASLHKLPLAYPGIYNSPPNKLNEAKDYVEGGTSALLFRFGNFSVLNLGSANFVESALEGTECSCLLTSIAGRATDYTRKLLQIVKTKHIVPSHFDYVNTPLGTGGERVSIETFRKEIRETGLNLDLIVPEALKAMEFQTE